MSELSGVGTCLFCFLILQSAHARSLVTCDKGGSERKIALQLAAVMVESRVESDSITFNATISACDKGLRETILAHGPRRKRSPGPPRRLLRACWEEQN